MRRTMRVFAALFLLSLSRGASDHGLGWHWFSRQVDFPPLLDSRMLLGGRGGISCSIAILRGGGQSEKVQAGCPDRPMAETSGRGGKKGEMKKRAREEAEAAEADEGGKKKDEYSFKVIKADEDWAYIDQLPSRADLIRIYSTHPASMQNELDGLAGDWEVVNETRVENPEANVGLKLETVWDENEETQIGVRVAGVFEGSAPESTGRAAIGDWLVSVGGIKVGDMSLAQIGLRLGDPRVGTDAKDAKGGSEGGEDEEDEDDDDDGRGMAKETVRLLLRRGMGGKTPDEGGGFYHIDLTRSWIKGGYVENEDKESDSAEEREAREFLKKWVVGKDKDVGDEKSPKKSGQVD